MFFLPIVNIGRGDQDPRSKVTGNQVQMRFRRKLIRCENERRVTSETSAISL
ncbi:expressed unknown protein [Ectocarpus siliculosus]|uniref:Uncharacterized protein n=1 Tax=Ectocarpus siliculosus TaxID=2880 RepID=D7G5T5_ECTSI|nr:expressed unknown protein [Ectocarpus siliculosus]|eukprot:CBJ27382.1 expressed unknown protein [Ectocarpus siliculosus]